MISPGVACGQRRVCGHIPISDRSVPTWPSASASSSF